MELLQILKGVGLVVTALSGLFAIGRAISRQRLLLRHDLETLKRMRELRLPAEDLERSIQTQTKRIYGRSSGTVLAVLSLGMLVQATVILFEIIDPEGSVWEIMFYGSILVMLTGFLLDEYPRYRREVKESR